MVLALESLASLHPRSLAEPMGRPCKRALNHLLATHEKENRNRIQKRNKLILERTRGDTRASESELK
jgi:hypothetical protein